MPPTGSFPRKKTPVTTVVTGEGYSARRRRAISHRPAGGSTPPPFRIRSKAPQSVMASSEGVTESPEGVTHAQDPTACPDGAGPTPVAPTPAATVPAGLTDDFPPDLVDRIRRGDPDAVAEMVRRLGESVLYLARLILGPAGTDADAEEVAADALVAAWQRAAEFDPARGRFRTWVFMLLKYAALDRRRQLKRELRRRSGWLHRAGAGPGRRPGPRRTLAARLGPALTKACLRAATPWSHRRTPPSWWRRGTRRCGCAWPWSPCPRRNGTC
ncbi:hypothetical protein E1B22_00035 [Thermaerobacter sp. FW80]|nr:hypothetical protein E1B22_00035 [Thermaerobacter sp. FW80]